MTKSQSQQAERIFFAATELDASERAGYLEEACAGNATLRAEVEALLLAAESSAGYFDELPGRLGIDKLRGTAQESRHEARAGQQFGQYRLTSLLGVGGMGEVWRAERSDGRFEGEVAVKLLTRTGSGAALRRFDREANYLAKLAHANIARLIDAGIGPDDVPYLILDYVEGTSIDQYCDAHALSIESRLKLFVEVLEAVAHAHSRLIVHSDIKPSNVLVTSEGSVKLLDFGIATLLSAENPQDSATALTPEFAAPEQLAGTGISTATDVYSLGLLLYVLLAGSSPRDTASMDSLDQLRQVANREPPSLASTISDMNPATDERVRRLASSRGESPRRLLRTLRGELDDIVQKALAVEPHARYLTVGDFAADLRRYLGREPISAVPDSINYRTRKFVQRHRGGVLTATLTIIALISAAVITTWQSIEAQRQRDFAIRGQERALASNDLLNMLLGELGPGGEKMSLQQLLDRGTQIVEEQYGINERTTAMTYYDLSILYGRMGQLDTQLSLLDRSEAIGRNIDDDGLIANALCAKSRLKRERDAAGSAQDLEGGLEARERMPRREKSRVIECYRAEGMAQSAAGDHDGAIATYRSAINVLDEADVSSPGLRMTLLNDLGEQYFITDRPADSLQILEDLIELSDELGRGRTVNHVIFLANRGAILARLGEVLRASEAQRDAYERVSGMTRPMVGVGQHYASSLLRLARYDEALPIFTADYANAIESGNTRWQGQIAMQTAAALIRVSRLDEAESYLDTADAVLGEAPGANARQVATANLYRAELLGARGDYAAARNAVDEILAGLGYPDERSAPGLAGALRTAADLALASGDAAAALAFANDGLELATRMARRPELSADVGQALHQRARARRLMNDDAEAARDLKLALVSLANGFGDDHPETVRVRTLLADLTT